MRRALVVLAAVVVLGAWSCVPVSSGGGPVAGPTTTGLTALIGGEDWVYVGSGGDAPDWYDPGSGESWQNDLADYNLAFRVRESGIVDIEGAVRPTSNPPTSPNLFYLPEGYRPSGNTAYSATGLTTGATKYVACVVSVATDGLVSIASGDEAPYPAPGNGSASLALVYLSLQVFLTPSTAP